MIPFKDNSPPPEEDPEGEEEDLGAMAMVRAESGEPKDYPGLFMVTEERRDEYKKAMDRLNEMQRRFVHAYILDPTNKSAAARAAGYSEKTCAAKGSTLSSHPAVAAAIAIGMNNRAERTQITQDRILHELGIIGFSDVTAFLVDPETGVVELAPGVPDYMLRAISSIKRKSKTYFEDDGTPVREVEVEIKLWNKVEVLKLLMQHNNMLKPGENGGNTTINNVQINNTQQVWKVGDREITF